MNRTEIKEAFEAAIKVQIANGMEICDWIYFGASRCCCAVGAVVGCDPADFYYTRAAAKILGITVDETRAVELGFCASAVNINTDFEIAKQHPDLVEIAKQHPDLVEVGRELREQYITPESASLELE